MESIESLEVLQDSAEGKALLKAWQDTGDAGPYQTRDQKIWRRREEAKITAALEVLEKKAEAADGDFDEEAQRETLLLALRKGVIDSIEHAKLAKDELPFAERRQREQSAIDTAVTENKPPPPSAAEVMVILNDKAQLREHYRSRVFKPCIHMPTISLAEVADWEMKLETEKLGTKKPPPPPTEDEEEAKAREWDDWKDDNPRGWGNRKKNKG